MNKINIKNDFVFKEVFASNDDLSRGALQELLSAYLRREVIDVHITTNEIRANYLLQKETRMDINVIFNNGERANIEMQLVNHKDDLIPRMAYYLAQLFTSQPLRRKRYKDLHNTYSILIANFVIFDDEDEYHDCTLRTEKKVAIDLLHLITIELVKVKDKDVNEMNPIEGWNYFFRNYENEEKMGIIELIKKKWRGVAMAEEKITQITPEELARIQQIYDERWRMEEQWLFEDALEEKFESGKAKGLEEGFETGIKSTIAKMSKRLSIEEISETLEMDIEEVAKILNVEGNENKNLIVD